MVVLAMMQMRGMNGVPVQPVAMASLSAMFSDDEEYLIMKSFEKCTIYLLFIR